MYLILTEEHPYNANKSVEYEPVFTGDLIRVNKALEDQSCFVYKIDGLIRVRAIEISFNEITEEMQDD